MKISENNRQRSCDYDQEYNDIDQSCAGVIGVFAQNKLRIIDDNNNFIEREVEHVNRTVFDNDTKLTIEVKEAIAASYASVKNGIIVGVWNIEDECVCLSMFGRSWSRI